MKLLEVLGSSLASLLSKALSAAKLFFEWRKAKLELDEKKLDAERADKAEAADKQRAEDFAKKAREVASGGTLADLLDLPRSLPAIAMVSTAAALHLCGCVSRGPEVYTAKSWEGRYSSPASFYEATRSV